MLIDFPKELIEIIIDDYLSYRDLISLKLTCKSLKNLIDNKKIRNLNVFTSFNPFERRLIFLKKIIGYVNSICLKDMNTIISSSKIKENFKYLKRFIVYEKFQHNSKSFNLSQLTKSFKELEHLEIYALRKIKGYLGLKKLKYLFVLSYRNSKIVIDCEQLTALRIEGSIVAKALQLGNLTHLEIHLFSDHEYPSFFFKLYRKSLKLNHLTFKGNYSAYLKIKTQIRLHSLKELRLQLRNNLGADWIEDFNDIRRDFDGSETRVYFRDQDIFCKEFKEFSEKFIETDELGPFLDYDFVVKNLAEVRGFHPWIDSITINDTTDILNQKIIYNFKNLVCIEFENCYLDKETLNSLLRELRYIEYIVLDSVKNNLDNLNLIENYSLFSLDIKNQCDIGPSFIENFKNLYSIGFTNQKVKKDILYDFYKYHKYEKNIHFYTDKEESYELVLKKKSNKFNLIKKGLVGKSIESFANLDEFFDYAYKAQLGI